MKIEDCFPDDYVVIDVETSGLNPYTDRVLEIGVLVVEKREIVLPAFSWLLNPTFPDDGFEVSQKITDLTGITTEKVAGGRDPVFVLKKLKYLCDEKVIIAHNGIRFDRPFLNEEFKRWLVETFDGYLFTFGPHRFLDTAALFKGWRLGMLELLENYGFEEFAKRVLDTKAYGVYFNLKYCCEVLDVDTSDLGRAHSAAVDVVMVHRVAERLREVLV